MTSAEGAVVDRRAQVSRSTKETDIQVEVNLDGVGEYAVECPIGFFTHMLEQLSKHSRMDLTVRASGDIHVDGHHLVEDVGIALGEAVSTALGDKSGIYRYGSATLPMDEALVQCVLDLSGRTFFVADMPLPRAKLGEFDSELTEVFFEGFARGAQCNLHLRLLAGQNLHHCIEVSFKAFANALRQATSLDPRSVGVPSTKGVL